MAQPTAAERLRALATEVTPRKKTARVRQLLDQIEAAQEAGHTLTEILDELNKDGLDMTLDSFKAILHRVRKQRLEKGTKQNQQQPSAASKAAIGTPETSDAPDAGPKPATERPPTFTRTTGPQGKKLNLDE
ncbi:hypothetical protein [Burkholderia ubonensis]|uniref:Uncharacterized protein n=2 Tax=Burkholderia ubonensis TaxID=101571 RepID=A0A1R1J826_9BURK|nr:hypothetical protein [Burkholderia ubonensis]OMG71399.1 hypothetical protein BW685_21395 [Burkholderia ubonensis]